jgi:hypothetical protein
MWLLGGTSVAAGVLTVTGVTTGTSQPILYNAHGIITFYFRSVGTTSGGTLLIEEADWDLNEHPYSGTWSQIGSVSASTFTGGAQLAQHLSDSSYGYLRVRISSTITGGGTVLVSMRSRGAL